MPRPLPAPSYAAWAALLLFVQVAEGVFPRPMRLHSASNALARLRYRQPPTQTSCSSLVNHGTHSTVEIEVGTPPQKFDVVADTGSDNIIVMSCVCQDAMRCQTKDKCFRGTNKSKTFAMTKLLAGQHADAKERDDKLPVVMMTFGSGPIEAVIASDMVRVGQTQVMMKDSLLLMIDQDLQVQGPFEGIMGLGLPKQGDSAGTGKGNDSPFKLTPPQDQQQEGDDKPLSGYAFRPPGFLETANIARFSICFNHGSEGVLRLHSSKPEKALASVGQVHWGLDFRGVSVGKENAKVHFCDGSSKQKGQDTACGAIPDSGTTVMTAPAAHIKSLFTSICENWDRCRKAGRRSKQPMHETFQTLLMQCSDWLSHKEGLDSLPPLHFHLGSPDGEKQTVTLPGSFYVVESMGQEVMHITKNLMGIFPVDVAVPTGKEKKVCAPAFASQEYNTEKNGQVWIFGTPFFYKYQVGYDLSSKPPRISFTEASCGRCGADKVALVSQERRVVNGTFAAKERHIPAALQIHGPIRLPKIDPKQPL